ncbi:MAG: sigma-70 family RNA polymerase sigma factor [Bryobacteraceae bacterium]
MNVDESPDNREASALPSWAELIDKIKQNRADGLEELNRVFSGGVRYFLCRQVGRQGLDEQVRDTLLVVTQAIQRGELDDPERLVEFVRTIVRCQVAAQIEDNVRAPETGPEQDAIHRENQATAREVLRGAAPADREMLIRFYLRDQPEEQICSEMGVTETEFRMLKSRAKARFEELGKR